MKTRRKSFTGFRPIFTGSPSIVQGGFNLDVVKQNFAVTDTIPGGSLAIYDEQTRKVQIVKTAKVKEINADDAKIVSLQTDEFYTPCFCVGDKVLVIVSGTYANAPAITKINKANGGYVLTLDKAIAGLAVGDTVIEVVADASANASVIGTANALTISDIEVREFETPVDVTADTMQYALYERRVLPIPDSQKDETKQFLKGNPHIKLSQSY